MSKGSLFLFVAFFVVSSAAFASSQYSAVCDGGPVSSANTIGECEPIRQVHVMNAYDWAKECALKTATSECLKAGNIQCAYLTESVPTWVWANLPGYLNCRVEVTVLGSATNTSQGMPGVSTLRFKAKQQFLFDASKGVPTYFANNQIRPTNPPDDNYCDFSAGFPGTASRMIQIGETFQLDRVDWYRPMFQDVRGVTVSCGESVKSVSDMRQALGAYFEVSQ